jgi:hypothetical protein
LKVVRGEDRMKAMNHQPKAVVVLQPNLYIGFGFGDHQPKPFVVRIRNGSGDRDLNLNLAVNRSLYLVQR